MVTRYYTIPSERDKYVYWGCVSTVILFVLYVRMSPDFKLFLWNEINLPVRSADLLESINFIPSVFGYRALYFVADIPESTDASLL